MDEAKNGVIYFSLGSLIDSSKAFDDTKVGIFLSVFSRLDVRVIWKWAGQEIQDKPGNILIGKWLPQQDILS